MININDMLPIKTNGRTIPINELRMETKSIIEQICSTDKNVLIINIT